MKKTLVLLGLLTGVSACSLLPDHDEDYRKAQDIAHVTLPPGSATRPLTELYPVPPETVKPTFGKGKFKAPKPMPVAISGVGGELPAAGTGDSTVSLARDGNGYPSLSATGSFDQVWDTLDQALIAAGVKIDDRNQTLAIYYLQLPDDSGKTSAYQLKVARAVNAYTMALQKDDDTLAPQAVASSLFDKIQTRWHAASGDNSDGKTRPAVHR